MKLKSVFKFISLVCTIAILVACAPKVVETATEPATIVTEAPDVTAAPPAPSFSGTVVIGDWQEPQGLLFHVFPGAHTTALLESIYYTPITLDSSDHLIPEMLEEIPSVENGGISPDYLTITLKFKQGFAWHDGPPVTSADLKFTWEFVMDPNSMAASTSGWSSVKSIDTPDDYTAVLHFSEVYLGFLEGRLIEPLMPKHLLEGIADPGNSDYARNPVGNGPFIFNEWVSGDHITVVANPNAPLPPKLERLIFKFVPDINTMIAMLRTGDIDVAWDLRETNIPDIMGLEGIQTAIIPGASVERYNLNQRDPNDLTKPHPILSDIRVRKAISMGMDRFSFVNNILSGYGKVAVTDMDNTPWINTALAPVPYDPEQAKALLDEAGWVVGGDGIRVKDGMQLSLRISTTAGNQLRENAQVLFQQNLKDIGIELVIENYPTAELWGGCAENGPWNTSNFDILGFASGASTLDWPSNFPEDFYCKNITNCTTNVGGSNASGYCDPVLDVKLSCIQTELDVAARNQCIAEAQQIIYDLYYPIYIYDRVQPYAFSEKVAGINPTPFGKLFYNYEAWSVVDN